IRPSYASRSCRISSRILDSSASCAATGRDALAATANAVTLNMQRNMDRSFEMVAGRAAHGSALQFTSREQVRRSPGSRRETRRGCVGPQDEWKRSIARRNESCIERRAIERAGNGRERLVLLAQLTLCGLRVLLAEMPDLVPERGLLRRKQSDGDQEAGGAPKHGLFRRHRVGQAVEDAGRVVLHHSKPAAQNNRLECVLDRRLRFD